MKVALFNDTASFSHLGCMAVSDAHARMLGRAGHTVEKRFFIDWNPKISGSNEEEMIKSLVNQEEFRSNIDSVDAVVVNGEGTIHHGAGIHLLAVLGAAQKLKKKTLLVNAVYEETMSFESVVKNLDEFTVREKESEEFAKSRGIDCRIVYDSCLDASFENNPLLDLSGKTVITDWHHEREKDVGFGLKKLMRDNPNSFYLPFERADANIMWQRVPSTIATCAEYITARHHGIYFAIKAKKPFVALPSNTKKIQGFMKTFNVNIPIATDYKKIAQAIKWMNENPVVYIDLFDRIEQKGPLDTFKVLGDKLDKDGEEREVAKLQNDLKNHFEKSGLMNGQWQTSSLSKKYLEMLQPKENNLILEIWNSLKG